MHYSHQHIFESEDSYQGNRHKPGIYQKNTTCATLCTGKLWQRDQEQRQRCVSGWEQRSQFWRFSFSQEFHWSERIPRRTSLWEVIGTSMCDPSPFHTVLYYNYPNLRPNFPVWLSWAIADIAPHLSLPSSPRLWSIVDSPACSLPSRRPQMHLNPYQKKASLRVLHPSEIYLLLVWKQNIPHIHRHIVQGADIATLRNTVTFGKEMDPSLWEQGLLLSIEQGSSNC